MISSDRGEQRGRAICQLDGARSNVYNRMMHIRHCSCDYVMMMAAFITLKKSVVPFIEVTCSSNPFEFEFSVFEVGLGRSKLFVRT